MKKKTPEVDQVAYRELELYIENESSIHRKKEAIIENIKRKMRFNKYDPKLAPKLWMYWVDDGARKYVTDFGGNVKDMFPKALREKLAHSLARKYGPLIKSGEFGVINHAPPHMRPYTDADEAAIQALESEGMTRSDAQSEYDAKLARQFKKNPREHSRGARHRRNPLPKGWLDAEFARSAGDRRYRYVPFDQLSSSDQDLARRMYVYKHGGGKYSFKDEHYFYPVKSSGKLAHARRVLAIPIKKINNDAYMASLGYEIHPDWKQNPRRRRNADGATSRDTSTGGASTRTSTGGSSSSPGGASTGGVGSGIGGAGTGGAATGGASTGGYGTVTINLPASALKRAAKANGQAAQFTFNVGGAATSGRVASGSGPGARGDGGRGDGSGGGGGGGNTPHNSGRNDKWMRRNPSSSGKHLPGINSSIYTKPVKMRGKHEQNLFSSAVGGPRAAKILQNRLLSWTKQDHAEAARHHLAQAKKLEALWSKIVDKAHMKKFGTKYTIFDYKISCIARDEYPEKVKKVLRRICREGQRHKSAAVLHSHIAKYSRGARR